MVEEQNSGRIVILDKAGKLVAEYVNRAADGKVYDLGWSRMISRAEGDAVLAALKARPACQ